MKPTVTREEVDNNKAYGSTHLPHVPYSLAQQIMFERDEAIREVERLKGELESQRGFVRAVVNPDHAICREELEAEKRRTAAFENVAVKIETEWRSKHDWVGEQRPEQIRSWVQQEAQKLLADSGGEK